LQHATLERDRVRNPDGYPFNLPALRHLSSLEFHPKVTFFVGENGSGKSTLLEAIAVEWGLNAEGGSVNFRFATQETHSPLHDALRLAKSPAAVVADSFFLRAESFYNVATEADRIEEEVGGMLRAYGGRSLHQQSHGESFFALFQNRMGARGLYLLDEPESALSPNRQLQFLALLHERCQAGAQFVLATHSPILLAYPEARIYTFGEDGIIPVAYEDTEHYRVTRNFLSNPARSLRLLLADDAEGSEKLPSGIREP
jgi:predicted ATPase